MTKAKRTKGSRLMSSFSRYPAGSRVPVGILLSLAFFVRATCLAQNPCIWAGGNGNWFPTGTQQSNWFGIVAGGRVSCIPTNGVTADIGNASGTGSLNGTVTLNGPVNLEGVVLGSGGSGTLIVSSSQNTLEANTLFIGNSSSGTLTVQNGGMATSTYVNIGAGAGANGNVTVTGTGSVLNATDPSGYFVVGNIGQGTLTISNGGRVNSVNPVIASSQGSNGSVTVTGAGSQWNNSNGMGLQSNGVLTISNGGVVNNLGGIFMGGGTDRCRQRLAMEYRVY